MFKCSKSLFSSFSHSYITVTFFSHSVFYNEVLYEHGRPWILWCSGSMLLCLMPCAMDVLLCRGCQTNLDSCCSVSISFSLGIRENNVKDKAWLAISWAGLLTAALNVLFRSWMYRIYSGDIYSVKSEGVYYLENSCYCFANHL